MKKYLHKPTGAIATPTHSSIKSQVYSVLLGKLSSTVLAELIENGQDWTEIKDPLFITEDNNSIYINQQYWVLSKKYWNIEPRIASETLMLSPHNLRFSTKEAAETYKKLHKPNYSQNDLFLAFSAGEYLHVEIRDFKNDIEEEFEDYLKRIS